MTCYIDTHLAVWLNEVNLAKFSRKALSLLQTSDVRISPMVVVELAYLCEIGRVVVRPTDMPFKLRAEMGLTVSDHPFPTIAEMALAETWTGDPFDRIIGAHAKSNGAAPLVTKDERIRENYANARW